MSGSTNPFVIRRMKAWLVSALRVCLVWVNEVWFCSVQLGLSCLVNLQVKYPSPQLLHVCVRTVFAIFTPTHTNNNAHMVAYIDTEKILSSQNRLCCALSYSTQPRHLFSFQIENLTYVPLLWKLGNGSHVEMDAHWTQTS